MAVKKYYKKVIWDGTNTHTYYKLIINNGSANKSFGSVCIDDGIVPSTPQYLYLEASSSTATVELVGNGTPSWTGEYSLDGETWNTYILPATSGTSAITLSSGSRVYFRGTLSAANTGSKYLKFVLTGTLKAGGNINSLCYKDDFETRTTLTYPYCYAYLFTSCSQLRNISDLTLPATVLSANCYDSMFVNSYVRSVPDLPATTLAVNCYKNMFKGCSFITTAPTILPATTLQNYCYSNMFNNCTSLTNAPQLPSTNLANYCYENMFYGCDNLTTAPNLPATTLTSNCYYGMFYSCDSLTTAPALPATTLTTNCYYQMFYNCNNINDIPDFQHIIAAGSSSLCNIGNFETKTTLRIRLGTPLTTLDINAFTPYGLSSSQKIRVEYHFTDSDTPQFDTANCIRAGTSKNTLTYYIYTDNTAIKDACLAKADSYTIVNVYHLDGSAW